MRAVISLMYLSRDRQNPYGDMEKYIKYFCRYRGLDLIESKCKISKNKRPVLTVYVDNWEREYLEGLLKGVHRRFSGKVRVFVGILH